MIGDRILLAHGEGGRRSRDLVESIFLKAFGNRWLEGLDDGAVLPPTEGTMVFTTDSYVVRPLFFPGGDIGRLAVYGTCNDLAVMGARPAFLSCGFIVEEGTEIATLERIAVSMAEACAACDTTIVTGDTKVVERGAADSVFINTAGIGCRPGGIDPAPGRLAAGDRVIVSGTIGDHGIAVLSARERLSIETPVESDAAPLWPLIREILAAHGDAVHFMRDPTRGGLATALCEVADASGLGIEIREAEVPVQGPVRAVCEILGFDPLYIANEGKLLLVCAPDAADLILRAMKAHPLGAAAVIGEVVETPPGHVVLHTAAGGRRRVDMLSGEQLPRIC